MGNVFATSCFGLGQPGSRAVKLIFWEGATRVLTGKHVAGEIMFEFPDKMVCHADSFFIGRPIPALAIDDPLLPGNSYFVLPLDCFPCLRTLSASSVASLGLVNSPNRNGGGSNRSPMRNNFGEGKPFEYVKGDDGRVMIKVVPEFIAKLITKEPDEDEVNATTGTGSNSPLCSTPELKKHYDQLVGMNKEQLWSPKLETITEHKLRFSPCRFIGLEWKQKEGSSNLIK